MMNDFLCPQTRLADRFLQVKKEGRSAFISFICAGDPDFSTFQHILQRLPSAGVDVIEIGMPFSDPVADGETIQQGNMRALKAGITTSKILEAVRAFRQKDDKTPIALMGYYNPIFSYGVDRFVSDAKTAGVDALIMPDLPPEEDAELCIPAMKAGLNYIRFVTPTTDDERLKVVLERASGFLYYVSVTGVTGRQKADAESLRATLMHLKTKSDLPIAVGFGITTSDDVKKMASVADGVIVGSAIVKKIGEACVSESGAICAQGVDDVLSFVRTLTQGCRHAE